MVAFIITYLGLSDIMIGVCMCANGLCLQISSFAAAGRIIFLFGAYCACTMSASCILLISLQVRNGGTIKRL